MRVEPQSPLHLEHREKGQGLRGNTLRHGRTIIHFTQWQRNGPVLSELTYYLPTGLLLGQRPTQGWRARAGRCGVNSRDGL